MSLSERIGSKWIFPTLGLSLALVSAGFSTAPALAASHREAPFVTTVPKVDGTDFYMFRSYEPGRDGFVTLIADYIPLQAAYAAPNFFTLDANALYEIHIDNNGDAKEDITFQFRANNQRRDLSVNAGGKNIAIPIINLPPGITDPASASLNVVETYTIDVVRGGRRNNATRQAVTNARDGAKSFIKPVDNIGQKSIPDYASYAAKHIYDINIPGCSAPGRVFVGQRKEPFYIPLGEIFDLINLNPVGPRSGGINILDDENVTAFALELPISCVARSGEPVIGAWTTASLRQGRLLNAEQKRGDEHFTSLEGGAWVQVSRLGNPLVNELVIGLKDKDHFNGSRPKDDGQFLDYVTNPSVPVLINALFPIPATTPPSTPRNDLVAVFLTGVAGLNKPAGVKPSEMMRLNTSIAPTPAATQKDLGVLAGDNAGYPNGRRPIDDVVDITLRAALGVLNPAGPDHPAAADLATDGVQLPGAAAGQGASDFGTTFPYLNTPITASFKK
jgi:hypothetical protein